MLHAENHANNMDLVEESHLYQYIKPFQDVVLKHIEQRLDPLEWIRLRSFAASAKRYAPGLSQTYSKFAKPEELVIGSTWEDTVSVSNVMNPDDTPEEIGLIDGLPVYYLPGRGIYIFGETYFSDKTLTFWVTTPAYPPKW